MNKPKLGMAALAVILSGTTALSGPAHADTLIDALVAAYNSNPTLLAQRAGLRATDDERANSGSSARGVLSSRVGFGGRRGCGSSRGGSGRSRILRADFCPGRSSGR